MRPFLVAASALLLMLAPTCTASLAYVWNQQLPPRIQWMTNEGYCGEESEQVAGLRWGQYMSQYDIRYVATGNQSTWYEPGVNDVATNDALRFNTADYPNTCDMKLPHNNCSQTYLAWIKAMARRGYSVTLTVYMNQWLFHFNDDYNAGYPDYDHIVTLYEWQSNYDDDEYHDDDIMTFSDHGVWDLEKKKVPVTYLFSYKLSECQGSRQHANDHKGNIYTVPSAWKLGNFGVAHRGPADPTQVLLPVTIATDKNYESPSIDDGSQRRPPPMPLQLNITVSNVLSGVDYKAYLYGSYSKVPVKDFNARAADADETVPFTGDGSGSFVLQRNIESSSMVFVRVVRADAP